MEELALIFRGETAQLRSTVSRRQNARLPAVALPSELLSEIFIHACCRDYHGEAKARHDGHFFYNESLEPTGSPIIRQLREPLAATCSRWREIAISTTLLWNSISIQLRIPRVPDPRHPASPIKPLIPSVNQVHLELERSGTRPIQLRLIINHTSFHERNRPAPADWRGLVAVIEAHLPRCSRIHFQVDSAALLDDLLNMTFSTTLPHLLSFSVFSKHVRSRSLYNLSSVPHLQELAIAHPIGDLRLSWSSKITQLCLDPCVNFDVAVGIIESCTHIRQLYWGVGEIKEYATRNQARIILPFLEYLDYKERSNRVVNDHGVLSSIEAPRITTLVLASTLVLPTNFPTTCSLRCSAPTETSKEFLAFIKSLEHFPAVEDLRVDLGDELCADILLHGLRCHAKDGDWLLVPRLKHLVLDEETELLSVEKFLKARNANVPNGSGVTFAVVGNEGSIPPRLEPLRPSAIPFTEAYDPFGPGKW